MVRHKKTGKVALLVSGGFGFTKTVREKWLGGHQNPNFEERVGMILITNHAGNLIWANSNDYRVCQINGKRVGEYFGEISEDLVQAPNAGPKKLNIPKGS